MMTFISIFHLRERRVSQMAKTTTARARNISKRPCSQILPNTGQAWIFSPYTKKTTTSFYTYSIWSLAVTLF